MSVSERFWSKVDKSGDCWLWTATTYGPTGYGQFHLKRDDAKKDRVPAHRWSYEQEHGLIPSGMVIDHLCRNRLCVRPDHLEAVTQRMNILRGEAPTAAKAKQTHCKNGHVFDLINTLFERRGGRQCRECARRRLHEHRQRRRNASITA